MPSLCAVSTCTNSSLKTDKTVSYYRFPERDDLKKQWMYFCKRGDVFFNPKTARICSEHFAPEDFVRNLKAELLNYTPNRVYLKNEAVPRRNLPERPINGHPVPNAATSASNETASPRWPCKTPRQCRTEKREIRKRALCHIREISPKSNKIDFATNTEFAQECDVCTSLKNKICTEEAKVKSLQRKIKCLERQNATLRRKFRVLQKAHSRPKIGQGAGNPKRAPAPKKVISSRLDMVFKRPVIFKAVFIPLKKSTS